MDKDKKSEALAFARSVPVACLATVDGDTPHARAMEVARVDDDFSVWFSTSSCSNKIGQVGANANTCVLFWSGATDLKIVGRAAVIDDKALKDGLYKDKWDVHYPEGGKDDPNYAVIRVVPGVAEYRDMKKYGLAPENVL